MIRKLAFILIVPVLMLSACSQHPATRTDAPAPPAPTAPAKIKVNSLTDLPAHSYQVQGSVSQLLHDDAAFAAFAAKVRADLESDLATYDITDPSTLQGYYGALANLDMLDGRWKALAVDIEKTRELESKPAARATSGLVGDALIAVHERLGDDVALEALRPAFKREFAARVDTLSWDLVQDTVQKNNGRLQMLSPNLVNGMVQMQLDPIVAQKAELSGDLARNVIGLKAALATVLPLRDEITAVYTDYIEQNQKEKENIWPPREVTLGADGKYQPVVIGIWDSGVDLSVYKDRLWTNPKETADGKDDDGNGFVDDVHGIAFDVNAQPSTELLHPLGDMMGRVEKAQENIKGLMDLQASVESPEAQSLRQMMAAMPPEEVAPFMESLSFYGLYAHGSHVAGIASAGNPYARLLCARITFDYHTLPQAMTAEIARRWADDYARTVRYFQAAHVRVVNMSWGWTFREIESGLEANGVGATAEKRAELAGKLLDILEAGLKGAIESTPDILYVCAAGNDDNDVAFDRVIPSSWDLPNLLVVGAVDQAGDPTDFTAGGKTVRVYANGFEVESHVPGGKDMKMSGTSMASPQVCNLAGKLFTVRPALTPTQAVDLIVKGCTTKPDHPYIPLIDPRKSLDMALSMP